MSIRMKLADILSGGALTDQSNMASNRGELFSEYFRKYCEAVDALEEIAAIPVTSGSNGSLRKAVRIARDAVKK